MTVVVVVVGATMGCENVKKKLTIYNQPEVLAERLVGIVDIACCTVPGIVVVVAAAAVVVVVAWR